MYGYLSLTRKPVPDVGAFDFYPHLRGQRCQKKQRSNQLRSH
jgi:hypothetical protein